MVCMLSSKQILIKNWIHFCHRPWLERCLGLFTLTSVQMDFLEANLRPEFTFPIVRLFYPSPILERPNEEISFPLVQTIKEVLFVGDFDRDFQHFFNVKFQPAKFQKVLLLSDDSTIKKVVLKDNKRKIIKKISINCSITLLFQIIFNRIRMNKNIRVSREKKNVEWKSY